MKNRCLPWICFSLLVLAVTFYAGSALADSDSLSMSTLQQDKEQPEGDKKKKDPEGDKKEHPEHPEGDKELAEGVDELLQGEFGARQLLAAVRLGQHAVEGEGSLGEDEAD